MNPFKAYADWAIPANYQEDPDLYRRSRQLVLFTVIAPLFFIYNIIKWFKLGYPPLAWSMLIVGIIVTFVPVLLRITKSLAVMGNVIFLALACHFAFLPYVTGGIESSALFWNMALPAFAATFLGMRSFLAWAALMIAEVVFFIVIYKMGVPLPVVPLSPEQMMQAHFANMLGPLLALCITLYFNTRGFEQAFAMQNHSLEAQSEARRRQEEAAEQSRHLADRLEATFTQVGATTGRLATETLGEMSDMTRRNADSAKDADQLVRRSGSLVQTATSSMDALNSSMGEISRASDETMKIIKTIDEIAFQTNLLALNAAVEAARAGQAGVGFAVVADEVRNLAMRATEAAHDTSELLESNVARIKSGGRLVRETGQAFGEVADTFGRLESLLEEIAGASERQAKGIEDIGRAVEEVDQIIRSNTVTH